MIALKTAKETPVRGNLKLHIELTVCKVDFEVDIFNASINPQDIGLAADEGYLYANTMAGNQGRMNYDARIKIEVVPDITSTSYGIKFADTLCKKWELGFLQNVMDTSIIGDYINTIFKQIPKETPILDSKIETEPLNEKQSIDFNKQIINISDGDSPGFFMPFYDSRVVLPFPSLQKCSKHTEYMTWVTARNKETNEYKYLKNVKWRFDCDINVDQKTYTLLNGSGFSILSLSDGVGSIFKPVTTPPIASKNNAYNITLEAK